ncbi:MAG TPA: phosphoenolpyruvate synthase [Patescibacteria group bacterium]|uniref:Phosphoenolpyruvate synthase n=1 Tax=Candidatus Woesebacteria bacterium RBG_13_46_13 TaxID=1802479 RepID=A0A1F7X3X8_9BACT|nr:MAG: phosphoenolpyruvate synthase [Candidatus Woesebacteria bacterium RBG_13_46_13]HJX59631.1 phosphoenolpyruvate synthase [Patescibacteria group bacterium]
MPARPLIAFFKDIQKEDIPLVGGKGANLGEMANSGFPVPNGFAITVVAYDLFLGQNNLLQEVTRILKTTDHNDPQQLNHASKTIQKLILSGEIPKEVADATIKSYKRLSGPLRKALVAVRSSATAEDLPEASFAGQQETLLNIQGEANLLNATRKCWASLFTPRAIFYRVENKVPHEKVKISVIVQKMVQSEVSGVMFSIEPVTNEKDRIVIEAVWGLGEMIVQGQVVPDRYVVQKGTYAILSKQVSDQSVQLIKKGTETSQRDVPPKIRDRQKISDEEIVKLAKIAEALQKHYYFPQDAEWAKEGKNLYLVQTRPVTTTKKAVEAKGQDYTSALTSILTGTPASPGTASGPVTIIKTAKEIEKVQKGDILVAPMTSPDFVPAMRKAVAIVTDQGGQTSHAAIVSRELGIPCVVGTKMATSELKAGSIVTVDGDAGQVFLGSKVAHVVKEEKEVKPTQTKTATRLYVNLGEPERAKEISKLNVDGVGLLRAEFMIANIGIHPKEAIKNKKQDKFIDKLAHDIETFCEAFEPRPVVYRATDFKTNEYRALPGGKYWEPEEPNPLLGFRGAFRYVANPDVFNLELQAIKKVRQKYKNLWLMVPFVRSTEELATIRRIVAAEGFFESPTFKFWMMVELPVNVILIEDFIKVGIEGVSVGSNDLTMLLLGTDRDNSEVAKAFDERSASVLWSLRRVIRKCNKLGVSSSICGQAPSVYEDLVEKLVGYGVTSISVNPDAVNRVRNVIIEAERKVLSGK